MEIEQGDIDKLLRFAAQVEGNCQFLTYIKNITTERSRIHRDSIRTLDQYMANYRVESKVKFNFEGLNQFIIQLAYFLYSCKTFGKTPVIELDDIRVEQSYIKTGEKRFTVLLFYKIAEESMEDMQGFNVFNSIIEHIQAGLSSYIQNKKENGEASSPSETQFESSFELFWHQFKQIVESNFFSEKQTLFFLALEQTSLFYQYSMLYRIKNCSILDYIKTNPSRMETFKVFKNKDQALLVQYNQEKKRSKSQPETLRAKQRQIDNNLQTFFKKINENDTQIIQSKNQKDQACRVKFNFKMLQKEKISFEQVMARMVGGENMREEGKPKEFKRPLAQLDYFIQYSSERNSICVRLFMPNIVVNVQTSDFLMFQSNVLAFDAVNVSIQLSQLRVKTGEKNPKKIVAFKGTSSFNVKQPPLEKILMLIDITMIASRIYQPELNSQKYGQNASRQSYQKMNNIAKKVSHYTKLYMKCAKKVYEQ